MPNLVLMEILLNVATVVGVLATVTQRNEADRWDGVLETVIGFTLIGIWLFFYVSPARQDQHYITVTILGILSGGACIFLGCKDAFKTTER